MGGAASAAAVPLHGRGPDPAPLTALVFSSPPGAGVHLHAAGITHPGHVRSTNEDALLARIPDDEPVRLARGALFSIADGVGGQAAGEVASRTAVDVLAQEYFSPRAPHQIEAALSQSVLAANRAVHSLAHGADSSLHSMQTTLTALAFAGRQVYLAHAGDTRAYLFRGGTLTQLTGDHSEAAELLRLRLITPEQALTHPRRSVLTRALGGTLQLRPDFQRAPLQPGDRFLICTDGLWGELPAEELAATLASSPVTTTAPAAACERLLALALERGGTDNVSLYVIDVADPGPAVPAAPSGRLGRLLAGLRGGG